MEPLIQHDIFNTVRDSIQFFVNDTINRRRSILLVSKPNLEGALSIAPIEAALLDAGIPYKRRFTHSRPDYAPFIQISDGSDTTINVPSGLSLSTIIVDGIDCGRESLEDCLEGDTQVLVRAERFLVIPQSMEKDLLGKLQGAFLI